MRNRRRMNYFTVVLIFMLTAFYLTACAEKSENKEKKEVTQISDPNIVSLDSTAMKTAGIKVEEMKLEKLILPLNFPGKIMPDENRVAHIGSRIPGRVVEIKVNLGDDVREGEALAIIDSPELGEAESNFLKFEANLKVAEKGYERAKRLLDGKAIGLGEFQRREAEYLNTKAEFEAAKEKLYLLGMSKENIELLMSKHSINANFPVKASISGRVLKRNLTLGEVVDSSKELFTIIDLSRVWVIADVPEKDIPLVEKGQEASIKISSYPQERFKGKVTYISDIVDPLTRTVKVRIEVENPPKPHFDKEGHEGLIPFNKKENGRILKPEMFAEIQILTKPGSEILAVPEKAVLMEDGKKIIFLAKGNNSFEKREIEVREEIGGFYQVQKGLKHGDRIVTDGAFYLKSELLKAELEEE